MHFKKIYALNEITRFVFFKMSTFISAIGFLCIPLNKMKPLIANLSNMAVYEVTNTSSIFQHSDFITEQRGNLEQRSHWMLAHWM